MKAAEEKLHRAGIPRVSPLLVKMFARYSRNYLSRHFHSLRVLRNRMPSDNCARPLVIYLNHAAWWDPLVCLLLSREFFTKRSSFAPIDAAMLARYRFFRRLGFFGINPRSVDGARTFLRTAHAILDSPSRALWFTPQGRFADVRERPLRLEKGLGVIAAREPEAAFIPLAIEYSFWSEPRPEILVGFGQPIVPGDESARTAADRTRILSDGLKAIQDELAARACVRDGDDWIALNRGEPGLSTTSKAWSCSWLRGVGESFVANDFRDASR